MKTLYYLAIFFLLVLNPVFGQKDSSIIFLSAKGLLCYHVDSIIKIREQNEFGELTVPSITFTNNFRLPVHAIFDGIVDWVVKNEDIFIVSIKYGQYSICYENLHTSNFKKGATIKKGDVIGVEAQDYEGKFSITISINKEGKFLVPGKWFTKKSCL